MSFQIALSGLSAASTDLQITSNNIANANTIGFKSSRGEFADVFSGDSVGIGNGVRLTDVRQEFTQGNVEITGRQLVAPSSVHFSASRSIRSRSATGTSM